MSSLFVCFLTVFTKPLLLHLGEKIQNKQIIFNNKREKSLLFVGNVFGTVVLALCETGFYLPTGLSVITSVHTPLHLHLETLMNTPVHAELRSVEFYSVKQHRGVQENEKVLCRLTTRDCKEQSGNIRMASNRVLASEKQRCTKKRKCLYSILLAASNGL